MFPKSVSLWNSTQHQIGKESDQLQKLIRKWGRWVLLQKRNGLDFVLSHTKSIRNIKCSFYSYNQKETEESKKVPHKFRGTYFFDDKPLPKRGGWQFAVQEGTELRLQPGFHRPLPHSKQLNIKFNCRKMKFIRKKNPYARAEQSSCSFTSNAIPEGHSPVHRATHVPNSYPKNLK